MIAFVAALMILSTKPTVYMVGNAHFDTQWRWAATESVDVFLHNTLVQNFALFEKYPEYVFNFEGAVKYAWAKEYYPDLYEKLKGYVASGQWHPCGSCFDANDTNIPCPESAFRNILYAQKFYREEFGILTKDIMLPDCFGFSYTLPTIAAHCSLLGFSSQKLSWRQHSFFPDSESPVPFEFGHWKGIDGSSILCVTNGMGYAWCPTGKDSDFERIEEKLGSYPIPAAFLYYGTRSSMNKGDRGGSVLPESIAFIDGCVHNEDLPYRMVYSTSERIFEDYASEPGLPEYQGEMQMDVHGTGCFTSRTLMKRLNRLNEQALLSAETACSIAASLGTMEYPSYTIDECWKRILYHQFHDDLTGTSIDNAYEISYRDEYLTARQAEDVTLRALSSLAAKMDTRVSGGKPQLVFNPTSSVHRGLVRYTDENGDVAYKPCISSPFSLEIIDSRAPKASASKLKVTARSIENSIYRVTVDNNGDICSIIDKRCGRNLVSDGQMFGYAVFPADTSLTWPAWEILKDVVDSQPVGVKDDVVIETESYGPHRGCIKVSRKYGRSSFVQRIILTEGAADDRIDVENEIDWNSEGTLLKAAFPMSVACDSASYDLGLGYIRRGNNTERSYEVVAQRWADLSSPDGSYGITLLSDCKYGWDKPADNTLRLTLIHTPVAGEKFSYQSGLDIGHHTFTYSIVGHPCGFDPVQADRWADELNYCKEAIPVDGVHKGTGLGNKFSFISSSNPCVPIKSIRIDGGRLYVRTYEMSGRRAANSIRLMPDLLYWSRTDGIGDSIGDIFHSGPIAYESVAFQPRTIEVALPELASENGRHFETLQLPFNTISITSDSFTSIGKMDNSWRSYAAEILPSELTYCGVPFTFGDADVPNAVRCSAQEIPLPDGAVKLYVLAASIKGTRSGDFALGQKENGVKVPPYCGTILSEIPDDGPEIVYVGTHRHDSMKRNEPFEYTYMFLYEFDVPSGCSSLILPDNSGITILAASVEKQIIIDKNQL
ncbi:MAG: alpha-mannosidase [Bacteroidales bacterium]|nr:alpha-mannosidase [Candidatus Cryptobacteroides aphodequi]